MPEAKNDYILVSQLVFVLNKNVGLVWQKTHWKLEYRATFSNPKPKTTFFKSNEKQTHISSVKLNLNEL